jgi:hypothetical protein
MPCSNRAIVSSRLVARGRSMPFLVLIAGSEDSSIRHQDGNGRCRRPGATGLTQPSRLGMSVRSDWTAFVQSDNAICPTARFCPTGRIGPEPVLAEAGAQRRPSMARPFSPCHSRSWPLSLPAVGLDGLVERILSLAMRALAMGALAMRVEELLSRKGRAEGSHCKASRRPDNLRARDVRRGGTE